MSHPRPPAPSTGARRTTASLNIVLEFSRARQAGQPHAFEFEPQTYLLRNPGGGFESAEFPWSRELLADLRLARIPGGESDALHRIGAVLRNFLAGAGWSHHEHAIVKAAREGARINVTIRSAAAELYALPWEFVALKSTGQLLGSVPGLMVRYEWPETSTFPDRVDAAARRGRVLFAWSAAGGAVPADRHLAALTAAFADRPDVFDPARDVVAHATFAGIDQALADAACHGPPIDALHILCHGAASGATYGLALDDSQQPGVPVTVGAGRFQQLLAPHAGMVRMVVLAACDSSNAGELGNHLGSVAQMIHRAGVLAVIASRFPLSAEGSAQFAAAFYGELARRASIEQAFLAARAALVRDPGQLDWASVQLLGRDEDSDANYPLQLGAPPSAPTSPPSLPVAHVRADPAPVVLGEPPPRDATPAPKRRWILPLGLAGALALVGFLAALPGRTPRAEPPAAEPPAAEPPAPAPVEAPRPPPAPTGPTACSPAVDAYLRGFLPDHPDSAVDVALAIEIPRTGLVSVGNREHPDQLERAADLLLQSSPERLIELGGAGLPCHTTLVWRPPPPRRAAPRPTPESGRGTDPPTANPAAPKTAPPRRPGKCSRALVDYLRSVYPNDPAGAVEVSVEIEVPANGLFGVSCDNPDYQQRAFDVLFELPIDPLLEHGGASLPCKTRIVWRP